MNRIFLKMGQSTVLRFNGDRPKKVVIGNQNYYNVEFVEGTSDVTLQPLQTVPTNLFVYCQKKIYGFLITTKRHGNYDDLVNIDWVPAKRTIKIKSKIAVIHKKYVRKINHKLDIGKGLFVSNLVVTSFKNKNTVIVDFKIKNMTSKKFHFNKLKVFATRNNIKLENQIFVTRNDQFRPHKSVNVRLLVKLSSYRGFSLNIALEKQKTRHIIGKRYLR